MTDRAASEPLTLDRLAELVATYRWVEHRLFQLTGAWALQVSPPALQAFLDRVSGEHAWHAELWTDRQPLPPHLAPPADPPAGVGRLLASLADLGPAMADVGPAMADVGPATDDAGVAGPSPSVVPSAAVAPGPEGVSVGAPGPAGTEGVIALAGLARVVLPRLVVTYRTHLRRATPGTDGPEIRVLRFVLTDEVEAWQEAEWLVQGLLATPAAREAARQACARLEDALAGAHPHPGLVAWPEVPGEGVDVTAGPAR